MAAQRVRVVLECTVDTDKLPPETSPAEWLKDHIQVMPSSERYDQDGCVLSVDLEGYFLADDWNLHSCSVITD